MSILRRATGQEPAPVRTAPGIPSQNGKELSPREALIRSAPEPAKGHDLRELVLQLSKRLEVATKGGARHLYRSQLLALVDSEGRAALAEVGITPTPDILRTLVRDVMDELIRLGPIQALVDDETVSEIMVNGPEQIWIERSGKLVETDLHFRDSDHALQVIQRIIEPLGRKVDVSDG